MGTEAEVQHRRIRAAGVIAFDSRFVGPTYGAVEISLQLQLPSF